MVQMVSARLNLSLSVDCFWGEEKRNSNSNALASQDVDAGAEGEPGPFTKGAGEAAN